MFYVPGSRTGAPAPAPARPSWPRGPPWQAPAGRKVRVPADEPAPLRWSSAPRSARRRPAQRAGASSRGSPAASPHTATCRPDARAAVATPASNRSTAGWSGVASSANDGLRRSAASVYWTRSLVPMLKKSATSARPSATSAAAGISIITPRCTADGVGLRRRDDLVEHRHGPRPPHRPSRPWGA